MSQAVVTDYYTRRRQRDVIQASKRKLSTATTPSNDATDLKTNEDENLSKVKETRKKKRDAKQGKQQTRVTRASARKTQKVSSKTIKDYLSPKQESTTNELPEEVKTSTYHVKETLSIPVSPSKRTLAGDLEEDSPQKRRHVSPNEKNAPEKNILTTDPGKTAAEKTQKVSRNARKRLVLNCDENNGDKVLEPKDDTTEGIDNPPPRLASLRSRGKGKDVSKAVNIAEKLLAKKKESSETLTSTLKNKSNLKDLQETLMKMKDAKKRTKAAKCVKSKAVKDVNQVEKATSVATKKAYAYSRFHSLAQEIPKGLPLPFKYKILQEMFRSADTVVSMLFNRQETATWMKVQHSVKDMITKNFEKKDLGQIKHVFPEAYLYRQEKGIPTYSDHVKSSDYQLTLEPILDSEEAELFENKPKKLTSGMLVKRRQHFHLQLLDIVKTHHKAFLSTLEPAVEVDDNKLRRWHPQFQLDQVPDVSKAELPLPPDHDMKKCYSAKDVLDKAKDRLTKKAVDALKKVAERCSMTPDKNKEAKVEKNNNETPVKTTPPKPAIKGVSKTLLAKVREKEADKKLRLMMRSDEDDQHLERLKQLPDVAKALRMLFITEKKGALPLDYVSYKLVTACPTVCTAASSESYIRTMAKESTLLIKLTNIRKQEYVKLDKSVQLNEVFDEISNRIKILEKS